MLPKKIKILVDCHVFDGSFQGTTTYLRGLYSEFILHREVHFFLASKDCNKLKTIFGEHQNVTYIKYKYSNKYLRLLCDIPSIIKENNIDFAHFQYIVPPIKKCKYIVTIHDILFIDYPEYFPLRYRLKNKFLFKFSVLQSDIILTVSEFSKKQIQEYFKIKEVIVTPNAVDPIYFEPYSKEVVKEMILKKYGFDDYWIYVSRWEPRKNHHGLLKVFVEMRYYTKYTLVFIGNDSIENKEYDYYFKNLSKEVKSKIIRLKSVDFQDLVQLTRGASLSIYPSFAEGFGIPPLEAIAANIPSICSNITGMSDFNFMTSMRFDPKSPLDMKNCIDANLNTKTETLVVEKLKQTYNWKDSSHKLKTTIENII